MNPSSSGWLNKMLEEHHTYFDVSEKEAALYQQLRDVGFVYGHNILPLSKTKNIHFTLSQSELAKVNLAQALIKTHSKHADQKVDYCFEPMLDFYQLLQSENKFNFKLNFRSQKPDWQIENIIHQRVQPNLNILQKQFSRMITNVFLYIDALAFRRYLNGDEHICDFVTRYENLIINLIYLSLQRKAMAEKSRKMLTQIFIHSLRYNSITPKDCVNVDQLDISFLHAEAERHYVFDSFLLALFIDRKINEHEDSFIRQIGEKLNLSPTAIEKSKVELLSFIDQHHKNMIFFRTSHPLRNFYSHSYDRISRLIYRNKSRLIREIKADRELYRLLSLSIHRELDEQEKKRVNKQLREILKSIPSLAIFALPGGGVLLPLIVQLIPKLLPHSFDENRKD